jgi:hypothetical protein
MAVTLQMFLFTRRGNSTKIFPIAKLSSIVNLALIQSWLKIGCCLVTPKTGMQ